MTAHVRECPDQSNTRDFVAHTDDGNALRLRHQLFTPLGDLPGTAGDGNTEMDSMNLAAFGSECLLCRAGR